jgi:serine/threonine protein kinase
VSSVLIAERYRLVRPIGTGGMGRVWLARDDVLHRDVAIKEVIPPTGLADAEREELRQRTLREARAAAQLSHPNVVQIYDVVHAEQRPWIVMEYVKARSLHQVVRTGGPLSPKRTAEIGLAVLAALTAAHAAGVLHRDVKPSNVLIADDGRVVLSDFGLATMEGGESAVTRPGLVLGSPQYIAPERARDGISSPEADLWSLGATLYAAVEGRSPYARTNAMSTLTALATANPDPTEHAGPLKPVLNGLLRRNPRSRLAPDDVERLLRKVATGERSRVLRLPRPRPSREAVDATAATATSASRTVNANSPVPPAATLVGTPDPEAETVHLNGGRPSPPDAAPAPRRPYVRAAVLVVLVLAIISGVVYAAARFDGTPEGTVGGAHPTPTATPSAPVPLIVTSPSLAAPYALPSDWAWYIDPAGFSVGVPRGWSYTRAGAVAYFREPGGRELGLEPLPTLTDPLAETKDQRQQRVGSGELAGYTEVKLSPIQYFSACAEWEYTYDRGDGRRTHVIERRFTTEQGHGYRIVWDTPEFDFTSNNSNWWIITGSFHPAP